MVKSNGKLGVCVVGLGIGYAHAKAYSSMEDVDLYVCDLDPEKLARAQSELNVKGIFHSLDEVITSEAVNAVDAALPHHLHKEAALKVVETGKHFMTEKPIARTLEEADAMIDAARKAGIKFMVSENQCFDPAIIKTRELVESGLLGQIFMVNVFELWFARFKGWRTDREKMGGGNLIDSGIHAVNTFRTICGSEAESVYSLSTRFGFVELGGEDTNVVTIKLKNGAIGSIMTSWNVHHCGPLTHFAVYGNEGCVFQEWNGNWDLYLRTLKLPEGLSYRERPTKVEVQRTDTYKAACAHFVDCIINDKEPVTDGEEGRKDLELVLAAYRSAEIGAPVSLPL